MIASLHRFRRLAPLLGCLALSAVALRAADPSVTISFAGKSIVLGSADLAAFVRQDVTAFDFHEKKDHVYSGFPVRDLLAKAGVDFGEKLRGRALRQIVIAHCADRYDIVFALAEFDDAFNSRTILLVDRQDGQPLPEGQGPLRLVVPGDKRPARWARMVTSLEVVPVADSAGR
jgi:DMSO/TMAO reductase YedYZ molybdopterin-dependent catalytic subunit